MRAIYLKIKGHGSAIAFIVGFIWDNIMLTQVDHTFVNIMLGSYLIISALCILGMNIPAGASDWHKKFIEKSARWLPIILQFCIGSLFSAYIIFYTRSASLFSDWPSILFLIALVISNELFRKHYLSITLPVSIFFTVLFSYSIFSLPTLVGSMGVEIFIASGFVSLVIIYIICMLLSRITHERYSASRKSLWLSISLIYVLFNLAYFTNVIPPIPLALKEIGVYHSISRFDDGRYSLVFEPSFWYPFTSKTASVFHRQGNEAVIVWSSIFAPAKLTVPVFYLWQYFDEVDKTWVATDLVDFPIKGGREEGYRGYTIKSGIFAGRWRVDVQTIRKDIIGRVEFTVENSPTLPKKLVTEIR